MKLLLLTKDNKLLFDSTGEEIIANNSLNIVDNGEHIIIQLTEDYKTDSHIKVTTHPEGGLGYLDLNNEEEKI